jgi:hypothetical protein
MIIRSPEVTLPGKALLAVGPPVWAVEALWIKVIGEAAAGIAVKLIAVTFAPLTVTAVLAGLNAYPPLLGVTV